MPNYTCTRSVCLITLALLATTAQAYESQAERPNVVMFVADNLRYESCRYAGDKNAVTPNIDQLAGTGISFFNHLLNTPCSSSTQATLWTGKYASTHGMVINNLRIHPNHDTLGHLLTAKGYTCDYIGRWNLWTNWIGDPKQTQNAYCPPGESRLGFDGFWAAHHANPFNLDAFYFRNTPQPQKVSGWSPEHFTNLAISRIGHHAQTRKPFALVISYSLPDDPWTPENVPAEWYNQFKDESLEVPESPGTAPDGHANGSVAPTKQAGWGEEQREHARVYYAMIAALDHQIGKLLHALDKHQLAGNTIVVFTSDNSAQPGIDGTPTAHRTRRVPLLIRWPGRIPGGRRSNACISSVDIMPTLCGMLGVGFPDSVDGIDLSDSTRVDCSCEPDFAFLQGMGHPFLWKDGFEWRAVRDQNFTYVRYLVDDQELLFDNQHNAQQFTNLANNPTYTADLQRMRQWLTEKMLATGDEFRPSTWYRDHWTNNRMSLRGARGEFHREMGIK